jgi:hypothetical protein
VKREQITTTELREKMKDVCRNCNRPRSEHVKVFVPNRVATLCLDTCLEQGPRRKEYRP